MIMLRPSWYTLVQLVAAAHGHHRLTPAEFEVVLWEHTAFPVADLPLLTRQLKEYFGDHVPER